MKKKDKCFGTGCYSIVMDRVNEDRRQGLIEEEQRRIRRLGLLVDLTTSVLYQDVSMGVEEARETIWNTRRAVLALFPGKESTFEMLLLPRFERILYERWGVGLDGTVH